MPAFDRLTELFCRVDAAMTEAPSMCSDPSYTVRIHRISADGLKRNKLLIGITLCDPIIMS